jgi:intracellular sulfur oxidation DsrE/DsrF family protein
MKPQQLMKALISSALLALGLSLGAVAHAAEPAKEKLVMQVSDADPAKWNMALNNARNVQTELGKDKVEIEIVAYGPGIGMLKADAPISNRVTEAMETGVRLVACENTMTNQKLSKADMHDKISYAPAGVVQLMKRQREGWVYIRP